MTAGPLAARLIGSVLVVALGVSTCAVCIEAAMPQSQQMACCKDGELSCASHSRTHDCCLTEGSRSSDAVVTANTSVHPVKALIAWNGTAALHVSLVAQSRSHHPVAPSQLDFGPPPYIAFSSLLI